MDCDLWQDKIDAFVDAELPESQAGRFEEHLRACPACSSEVLARQRLKNDTRIAGQRFTPSPELQARIVRLAAKPSRKGWSRWLVLAPMAAVLVLAVLLGVFWRQGSLERQLVAQLTDEHLTTLTSNSPAQIASAEPENVEAWFAGKVPFKVEIPDLRGTAYNLIGGRVAYFQHAPAAHLIYNVHRHTVSVFMFRDHDATAALGSQTTPVSRSGFQTETWTEDGIRYFGISDGPAQDVKQLCDLLKAAT